MLTEIRLRNFKAFGEKEQTVPLSKINVFIGENGTGKSTVLQVLALLAQSAGGGALQSGKFQFSDYRDLVHGRQDRTNLELGFAGRTNRETYAKHDIEFSYTATFRRDAGVAEQNGRIHILHWPSLEPDQTLQGAYRYGDVMITPSQIGSSDASVDLVADRTVCRPISVAGGRMGDNAESRQKFEVLSTELRSVLECFSNAVKNSFVVKALRGFDGLSYQMADHPSNEPADAQSVISTFAYRREVEGKVATWLEKVTGVRVEVHLVPTKQATLRTVEGYNIYYEGFGTNQLVWPLLQVAISPEDSLIGIEEPEIHLHPKAQIKLCNVLADVAQKENKQLVLTTHSDHLVTGFLNMVAEGVLASDDLFIHFFEKKDVVATVTRLKVDDAGRLEGGLKGFMDVELEKLERRAKALTTKSARA